MVKIIDLIKSLPKPNKNRRVTVAYLVLFSLVAIPVILYQMKPTDPAAIASQEQKDLVTKVGSLIDLPTDEEPVTATISDKTQVGSQEFFANAQNGDKVLIYEKSKQVILYRPSTKKSLLLRLLQIQRQFKKWLVHQLLHSFLQKFLLQPPHRVPSHLL